MTKFYKITNENEFHHGLQYHDGLNEDILPFNPSGNCERGGIYFASKDILAFLDFGPWVREVTLPEGEPYYTNPGYSVKYKAHRVILGERKRWSDPAVFQSLLDDGCNPSARNNFAIIMASYCGYTEIVRLLLADRRVDSTALANYAIRWAANKGHTEIVQLLKEYYIKNGLTIPNYVL